MNNPIHIAKNIILKPAGIDETAIEKLARSLQGHAIDDADLYFQNVSYESWYLEDSQVKTGNFSIEKGVGVRVVSGDKTGFAYCDDILLPSMVEAIDAARSIALFSQATKTPLAIKTQQVHHYPMINPIEGMTKKEKIALLEAVDKEARRLDPRVVQVNASLAASHEVVMIADLNGRLMADVRPMVSLHVSVFVENKEGRRESARAGGGGRFGYDYLDKERAFEYVNDAVKEALVNLEAGPAPAGTMPVVLGPGLPGVLLHEAVGHGLEGDFNRKGLSAFSGKLNQQVASPTVTVVDNGAMPNRRGSVSIDDEGTPGQLTTLIENGILVNYMQDKLNARLMGMQSTGNCRRESYADIPLPRMTNTYMLAGEYEPSEIIASVKKGLYAVNFSGGQVDITSGQFVFSTSEAYLIENGKVTRPVKGATLIGHGPEVMNKITMVGNDLMLDKGVGMCGKDGQTVPVGVGQPTLKISALTVGGTKKD